MFRKITIAALSAVLGFGALAAAPATARADSFYFGITPHGPSFGFRADDRRHHARPGRHWDRRDCSVREALRKADRMGINRARVRGENRNTIRVAGIRRGHPVRVVFAKAPNCPVIR